MLYSSWARLDKTSMGKHVRNVCSCHSLRNNPCVCGCSLLTAHCSLVLLSLGG